MIEVPILFSIIIHGRPVPKPRMTGRDKFAQRPIVIRYFNWITAIKTTWLSHLPQIKRKMKRPPPYRAGLEVHVFAPRPRGDADNYLKGICDGLVKIGAFTDDGVGDIPFKYITVTDTCKECEHAKAKGHCGKTGRCQRTAAFVAFHEPSIESSSIYRTARDGVKNWHP